MPPSVPSTLTIAGREIARTETGPFEAEYALFEADSIELRRTEPQTVREVGYRTTVAEARERLAAMGATLEGAERAAEAMRGGLAEVYARGPVVRRVATTLGARELFEGRVYSSDTRTFAGVWLDLDVLATHLGDRAASALQLAHLVALLHEVPDDADVFLSTLPFSTLQRPGYRSYRRVALIPFDELAARITELGAEAATTPLHDSGPSRVEILDEIGASMATATESAIERLAALQRATSTSRSAPDRGPLSDPAAWSIEAQINAGDLAGAMESISAMEQARGELPVAVYLRSRASLLMAREEPRVIAERVSKLASKSTFVELELLAAQAWAAAGEMARALPYARVLAGNQQVHEDLRAHAMQIVRAAERGDPSVPPRGRSAPVARSSQPERTTARPPDAAANRFSQRGPSGSAAPTLSRPATPGHAWARGAPSEPPDFELSLAAPPTPRVSQPVPDRARSSRPDPSATPLPFVLEPSFVANDEEAHVKESGVHESARPAPLEDRGPRDARRVPTEPPPPTDPQTWMRGASRPAFRAIPRRSTPTHLAVGVGDVAETLPDPSIDSLADDDVAQRLHTLRLQFTQMSRELGRLYRTQHSIELRTDLTSIEAMQTQLHERYSQKGVRTTAAAADVRRHGAFMSEILARTLGARWVDVEPSELGYWAMVVPPQIRVWPFGRVLRFIAMGGRERDLVSYYLELCARSA